MGEAIRGKQLDRLAEFVDNQRSGQVFSVTWNSSYLTFELREGCDGYYSVTMSPEELIELGTELIKAGTERLK